MRTYPTGDPWLRRYGGRAQCRVRLVCLPHAGGAANFYRPWRQHLPADIELVVVQYPGRQDRLAEDPPDDLPAVALQVARSLDALAPLPLVLFGHSMGSLVAYETALRLESAYGIRPELLVVSASGPPHGKRPRTVDYESDDALRAEIMRSDPHGPEICADPELTELVLPPLRADFRMLDRYWPRDTRRPTESPVLACFGTEDPDVTEAEMADWRHSTRAGFELRAFQGGHFYLTEGSQEKVLSHLLDRLNGEAAG